MKVWYPFLLISSLFLAQVTRGEGVNVCLDPGHSRYSCSAGITAVDLGGCGLTDADVADLDACYNNAGKLGITWLSMSSNSLTVLPAGIFEGLTSLQELFLYDNDLDTIEDGVFQDVLSLENMYIQRNSLTELPGAGLAGLTSLQRLYLYRNALKTLPVGIFDDLQSLTRLYLYGNSLTTLPAGIFDGLQSLENLRLTEFSADVRTNAIQCLPEMPTTPTILYETPAGTCVCTLEGMSDADAVDLLCGADMTCESGTIGYTCESSVGGTGDPHMVGFSGQKFDFTGENGSWYALLKDDFSNINMRVTAPLRELKEITYITGISIMAPDLDDNMHTMVIYVEHPEDLHSACPMNEVPCLADGALAILLDGTQVVSPGKITLGRGISFGAVNLPGECRPFGFEKYWERKIREAEEAATGHSRRLDEDIHISMAEWVLADHLATNKLKCEAYVERETGELFAHQSEHVSFQLNTPAFTMRLNYGKLHQLAMRDPTDQFDLPDHLTHQMNLGLSRVILGSFPEGILGETTAVRTDMDGVPIMTGIKVISGNEEDYKVEGALGTSFKQTFH